MEMPRGVGSGLIAGIAAVLAASGAVFAAFSAGGWPRWVRVTLVAGSLIFATGAGLYAYRASTVPVTLTLAAGSANGEAVRILSALAGQIAATNAPVRLKIIDKGTAIGAEQAFAAGESDLAIMRGDIDDTSSARSIVLITHGVLLLIVPAGSTITDMDGLKGKTVGVLGGPANRRIVDVLNREYDLLNNKVRFQDLNIAEATKAIQAKTVQALLVVTPISERYLAMLRNIVPATAKQKPSLIAIESAGAIAATDKYYESYDLPKGSLRGSPPFPDDDLTTLRVPFYLVAKKSLSDDTAGNLAKAIIENRRAIVGEHPVMAQITTPDTDKDAYFQIHPGAAAYFDGDQKTFFDKYSDQFYYGSMMLGILMSVLAGLWKFLGPGRSSADRNPLGRLYAFTEQIRNAKDESELGAIEHSIDDILKKELEQYAQGDAEAGEVAALGLATHRLEYLVTQKRHALAARPYTIKAVAETR